MKNKIDLRIHFGETSVLNENPFYLDLKNDRLYFIYLFGDTGSGKSIFNNIGIYGYLISNNQPEDLGITFIDLTRVDYQELESSGYFVQTPILKTEEGLEYLEMIATKGNIYNKPLFIHIEECNIFVQYPERSIKAINSILDIAEEESIFIVYSSSRNVPVLFENKLSKLINRVDIKVVFRTTSLEDSLKLLGNDSALKLDKPGEKIVCFKNMQIHCNPLLIVN